MEKKTLEQRVSELEKKMDALLNGDLSTSFEKEFVSTFNQIGKEIDERYEENLRKLEMN
ncbi:hypothetical protein QNH23_06510 [Siminovitchia fortis]|uniref:hypothetical protein n=1 Tax=Siminovitchia fortis TaxID=254758 RepID=UPI0013E2B067|nr:hypothetical protein [Siminovitchia fortis]WHY83024.1 hypothetical protein QNH23_06510 [Siminovitchia fortis]